jgi:conjugation system TraG family ATPase
MKTKELRNYIPILGIKDNCVLSKRGDLTFGWRLVLPTAYTVSEAEYDSIIASFLQAYRLLPPYCVVHKQDIYKRDTYHGRKGGSFLASSYQKHFEGRKFLNGYSYLYLTFSSKSTLSKENSDSGFFGLSSGKKISKERIAECFNFASQFEAVLKNNPMLEIIQLKSDDYLRMDENGQDMGVIPEFLRLYDNDSAEYNLDFRGDAVIVGNKWLKTWYVEDSDAYPSSVDSVKLIGSMSKGASKVFLSGGSPIGYNLRIPHIVNRYVMTLPKSTVESELDQKRRLMNSFSLYSPACAVGSDEIKKYLLDAQSDNTVTVKCFMNVMAWGHRDELADIRNKIVTAFHSELQVSIVEETRVTPLLHYAAIPGAEAELGADNYLTSEITAFLCHGLWDGYDFGLKNGVVNLCDRQCLIPVRTDLQSIAREAGRINNMNMLVVGPSGSGKSFTMNSLVQDFYESGEHICVVDVGDSYQGLAQVIREESGGADGVYNTYDPENPYGFNPFKGRQHWNDLDEDGENASSGYEFILSLYKTIYKPEKGWTNESSSILKFMLSQFLGWWDNGVPDNVVEDLQDAYANERRRRSERNHRKFDESKALLGWKDATKEIFSRPDKGEDPLFDDFYQYVTRIASPLMRDENFFMGDIPVKADLLDLDRFGAAMDMYKKGGIYGYLLNAVDEPDLFKSRLTVFEVDKIKDNADLFPIWLLCIMHSFEDKMRALPCQKVLIIEEAWKAIATETMANFIVWMWRTARKFRTSAIVVTQDINDLIGSDIVKGAIIQNSDVRILLDQRKNANNFQNAVKVLGLSEMATNLVLSVNTDLQPGHRYKEGFFAIGESYCNVFAIEVSLEQALAFETDKTLKKPILDRAKECGSIIQAIREAADDIRSRGKKDN